jgi:hypothetical protein
VGGVEACSDGEHAGHVKALHHGQLATHIGEAGGVLVPWLGKGGVGGPAEELHCRRTEPPHSFNQGFKGHCAERVSRTAMVHKVVSVLVGVPKSSGMAGGARSLSNVRSGKLMDG